MTRRVLAIAAVAAAFPAAAFAQDWVPGSEIVGQSVQVETNGVVNTLYFDQGGGLRIMTPQGRTVSGSWSVNGNQLCINAGGAAAECVPYAQAFQAGQRLTLTSSCNAVSAWTANAVNPPPRVEIQSERG